MSNRKVPRKCKDIIVSMTESYRIKTLLDRALVSAGTMPTPHRNDAVFAFSSGFSL
jgi:hypothetical protein